MKHLTTLCLLLLHLFCSGQSFDANSKMQGVVFTASGKHEGAIDVNLALNQALWSQGNQMKIFGARQIQQVKLTSPNHIEASYMGFEINDAHYLFEVVAEGRVTILYREGLVKDEFTHAEYSPYFIRTSNGQLQELSRKKDFLDAFGDDSKWMSLHIKNHDLDLDKKEDVKQIFGYYNQSYEATHPSP